MAIEFIAIGASLGGIGALKKLFSCLPDNFDIPIAVVLHRSPVQYDYLISVLQKSTTKSIHEACDKLTIDNRSIIVAPADYHLLVDSGRFALSVDRPVEHARPSIDVLFDSVAFEYGSMALGVLLTGGGRDGVCGMQHIKASGGSALVQSPESAQDPTLPQAAIDAGIVDVGYPMDQLSARIGQLCGRGTLHKSEDVH